MSDSNDIEGVSDMKEPKSYIGVTGPIVVCDAEFGNGDKADHGETHSFAGVSVTVDLDKNELPIAATIVVNRENPPKNIGWKNGFSDRERDLMITGLSILEGECIGKELHPELEEELGGTPESEEIQALSNKIQGLCTRELRAAMTKKARQDFIDRQKGDISGS